MPGTVCAPMKLVFSHTSISLAPYYVVKLFVDVFRFFFSFSLLFLCSPIFFNFGFPSHELNWTSRRTGNHTRLITQSAETTIQTHTTVGTLPLVCRAPCYVLNHIVSGSHGRSSSKEKIVLNEQLYSEKKPLPRKSVSQCCKGTSPMNYS